MENYITNIIAHRYIKYLVSYSQNAMPPSSLSLYFSPSTNKNNHTHFALSVCYVTHKVFTVTRKSTHTHTPTSSERRFERKRSRSYFEYRTQKNIWSKIREKGDWEEHGTIFHFHFHFNINPPTYTHTHLHISTIHRAALYIINILCIWPNINNKCERSPFFAFALRSSMYICAPFFGW